MLELSNEPQIEASVPGAYAAIEQGLAKAGPLRLVEFPPVRTDTLAASGFARGGLAPRVLRRLREHIDANIDQRIRVEALARLANLSVCYFVRAFKQSVGVTPHDYLIRRRVERAMELLSGTDLSLSEIALAAGFADQSHCARRFRQHVGMSPRDYRWSIP
ncbi:MAG: helix-turn-helix domain-containing protein [Bradyrhizobium sp.]|nr:AraC family transcriptional regulator [Bradyrhizobium sp.]